MYRVEVKIFDDGKLVEAVIGDGLYGVVSQSDGCFQIGVGNKTPIDMALLIAHLDVLRDVLVAKTPFLVVLIEKIKADIKANAEAKIDA